MGQYKKKDFDFMDYSTLKNKKHICTFCKEEKPASYWATNFEKEEHFIFVCWLCAQNVLPKLIGEAVETIPCTKQVMRQRIKNIMSEIWQSLALSHYK